ncbi:MAG: rhomboid family intramembrane serine protease [Microcoleus vaginatus WJT46-NPBG5]|jgi:membrane associated rhomboid family serine protease|nr:rhomboid family intramembrane serine protease [Microcoleus vaginatus WJT46-NPBG5]
MSRDDTKSIARELKTQATILGGFIALIWILELVDLFVFGGALNSYGIVPRRVFGLRGILFAPFLHGNLVHLMANTVPFLTLGWLVMLQETSDFFVVSAVTMVVGGLGVWLFGSAGIHIGASGVIFGYLGFLLFRGFFERNIPSIFLSLIVGFFYGGLIWGVLPAQVGISWEGHLFGFLGGALAAKMLAGRKQPA